MRSAKSLLVALVALPLLLTGCSGPGGHRATRATSPVTVPPRTDPRPMSEADAVELHRRVASPVSRSTLADHRGKVVVVNTWWSDSSPVPHRDADAGRRRRRTSRTTRRSSASTSATPSAEQGKAFERRLRGSTYPSFYEPDGKALLAFSGKKSAFSRIPTTAVLDRRGPGGGGDQGRIPSRLTLAGSWRTWARSQEGPRRWVSRSRPGGSGSLVLAIPVALLAGLVSFFSPA